MTDSLTEFYDGPVTNPLFAPITDGQGESLGLEPRQMTPVEIAEAAERAALWPFGLDRREVLPDHVVVDVAKISAVTGDRTDPHIVRARLSNRELFDTTVLAHATKLEVDTSVQNLRRSISMLGGFGLAEAA